MPMVLHKLTYRYRFAIVFVFMAALLVGQQAFGDGPVATTSDKDVTDFFDKKMTEAMSSLAIPGAALVVVRDGRVIFAKGYGYADVEHRRPVDVEHTVFRAASISKVLPWLAVMQLVEEGKLDLDRDVNTYLDFKIPDRFGKTVTMRHLMTHTAGFPERFHGVFDPQVSVPLAEVLRKNIPHRVYPPGTTIAYSNYGAALAGYIAERLRNRPWDQVAAKQILRPTGMDHSTVLQPVPQEMRDDLASTYSFGDPRPAEFRLTPLAPMGSLSTTAADMGRLLTMLMRGGEGLRERVIGESTLRQMLTLQQPLGPKLKDGFGLGFLVGEYHGVHYAGHAGNMSTLATDLELLPDQQLGWYYVFNSQGEREGARQFRDQLLHAAIERFATAGENREVTHNPSSAADIAGDWISTRRLAAGPLLFSGLMNSTVVTAEADGSVMIESSGKVTRWSPAGHDRFIEQQTGVPLAVSRDEHGRPIRIASADLYPAAEFERPPSFVYLVPFVAAFSFGVMAIAVVVRLIMAFVAGRRSSRAVADARKVQAIRRWARRSFWIIAATQLCWGVFGLMLAVDFGYLFVFPAAARVALGLLTIATAPLALIVCADAVAAWRDETRSSVNRLCSSIVALALCGIAALFYSLDVINFSTNW